VIMGVRAPVYAPYAALAPRPEGLSALADQQLGGTMMLEPASLPLLIALLWALKRWVELQAAVRGPELARRETSRA
jgi:cytochrome c oxidase assembly factor CtaG